MYIGMYTIVQWSSVSIDKNMKLDQCKAQLIHASRSNFICKKIITICDINSAAKSFNNCRSFGQFR